MSENMRQSDRDVTNDKSVGFSMITLLAASLLSS